MIYDLLWRNKCARGRLKFCIMQLQFMKHVKPNLLKLLAVAVTPHTSINNVRIQKELSIAYEAGNMLNK